nr:uncharacterized protein LOC128692872 [Cherax quadricarinatus]
MANRTIAHRRKWALDLAGRRGERGSDNLPAPPGYRSSINQVHAEANRQGDPNLVIKKAWDTALSPLKSVSLYAYTVSAMDTIFFNTLPGARDFEGFEDEPESVEDIVSLGKTLGLEVTEDDVEELVEEHRTELTTEELCTLDILNITKSIRKLLLLFLSFFFFLQKLIYLLGNLVNVGLAVYKCHSMGILPTHASDWLAFQEPAIQMEFSHGGMALL